MALVGGSASFGATAVTASPPGIHVHYGAHGEADANVCSDAVPVGYARCAARVRTDAAVRGSRPTRAGRPAAPNASGVIGDQGAYSPAFLQSAYNVASATQGVGQTIAVVDAFDSPTAASDLATYRSTFGLPPCTVASGCFRKVDQAGGTHFPTPDAGWSQEISIDVDMVSAICPNCRILLVEASSSTVLDLGAAVNMAVTMGANVVSNSYGGAEDASDFSYNARFFHHPGVTIVASSGDSGYGVDFPASSGDVVAVGGTSLIQNNATGSRSGSETAWNRAGSGCSAYFTKPSWQHDAGCAKRTVADVSAVADPATAVWVVWRGGWSAFGGTSVAAPIVGAMYGRAGNPVVPGSQPASYPYAGVSALNDVVSGSNGICFGSYLCTAGDGYDGPTGLGTPNTSAAFSATPPAPGPPSPPPPPPPPPPTPTAPGAPNALTAVAGDATVQLSWSPPTSTGGSGVSYSVFRGTGSGGESLVASGLTNTSDADSGLTDGVTYYYIVQAVNAVGAGPSSNEVSATPVRASVLGPPVNLVATTSPKRGVALSWSAPASNGGSAINGYRVYRSLSAGSETLYTTVSCTAASCGITDSGTHRTTYYYEVAAVTAKGVGPLSNQASALAQ